MNAERDCDGPVDVEVKNPTHWQLPQPPEGAGE